MGSARLQGKRQALEPREPDPSQGFDNQPQGTAVRGMSHRAREEQERQAQEQAVNAALREAEQAARTKTEELYASVGGVSGESYGRGTSSYTGGNPGQGDVQSQGDVDLSTSDTTLRRRGGYRRDAGIRI